jgi:hypothetical protein
MDKNIYIDRTVSLWGGQNGEINMELEDGTVLTFNAYNLMRDIPSITRMVFDEVMCEKLNVQKDFKELAKFIVK